MTKPVALLLAVALLGFTACGATSDEGAAGPRPTSDTGVGQAAAAAGQDDKEGTSDDDARGRDDADGTEVRVAGSEFGTMLFDSNRQAIYIFERDTEGKSVCYGECAQAWPPVFTDGKPVAGNPFDNEVYSYGHRNVEGLAFDGQGRLWASEFGEQAWDELNLITEGGNYGWPEVEGSGRAPGMINPKVVWSTDEASPAGLAFWRGSLWMAALRGTRLWEIPTDGEKTGSPVAHFTGRHGRIRSVVVSADGDSLLVTNSNTDGRGDPEAGDDRLLELTD